MRFRRYVFLTVSSLLCLGGCVTTTNPDGTTRMSLSPANLLRSEPPATAATHAPYSQPDPAQVERIASRFARDRQSGGMTGAAADIARCYKTASTTTATLDCIGLDFVANKREAYNVQKFHVGTSDYLTSEGLQSRVGKAGSKIGYTSDQLMGFMTTTGMAAYQRGAAL